MAKKKKIYIKPSKRGSLRKATGTPKGEKIPASKLKVKAGDSKAMKKKKIFAQNARKWKKPDGGVVGYDEYGLGGWISGALSGAGAGASAGALFGGVGAIPGAIIGGIAGGIGSGLGQRNQEQQQEKMMKQQERLAEIYANRADNSMDNTAPGQTLVNNMYMPTFATGGSIPQMPVELENNEIYMKPGDNTVYEVDGKYHSQGGEDFMLPVGTKVLGKNINPDTGNTFKEDGKKLMAMGGIVDKSRPRTIAANTENRRQAQRVTGFNKLFKKQEMCRGGKVKRRKMQGGGTAGYDMLLNNISQGGFNFGLGQNQFAPAGGMFPSNSTLFSPAAGSPIGSRQFGMNYLTGERINPGLFNLDPNFDFQGMGNSFLGDLSGLSNASASPVTASGGNNISPLTSGLMSPHSMAQGPITPPVTQAALGVNQPGNLTGAGLGLIGKTRNYLNSPQGNWVGGLLNTVGQLAPAIYNIGQGVTPAEQLTASDYYNPEYNRVKDLNRQAIDQLRNRKFNIQPMLEANRTAQATGDYNVATELAGMGAGAIASNRLANRGQRMRRDDAAWAQKSNVENQYAPQLASGMMGYGQTLAGLGAQRAGTDYQVALDNMASRASRRSHLGQGFNDVSQYLQMQQLMGNQQARDRMLLDIYPDMFGTILPHMSGMQNIIRGYGS